MLERAGEPLEGFRPVFVMNPEDGGFDCPGCAWPDDPNGIHLDVWKDGVKHVAWELAPSDSPGTQLRRNQVPVLVKLAPGGDNESP